MLRKLREERYLFFSLRGIRGKVFAVFFLKSRRISFASKNKRRIFEDAEEV